jgi:hypothetical protein
MAWHLPQKCGNQKKIASLNLFGRIQIMLHSYKPLALDFCFVVEWNVLLSLVLTFATHSISWTSIELQKVGESTFIFIYQPCKCIQALWNLQSNDGI